MMPRCLVLALSVAVLTPGLLRAQTYTFSSKIKVVPDHNKMYEDIEIFGASWIASCTPFTRGPTIRRTEAG